jgi:hypothetical protein
MRRLAVLILVPALLLLAGCTKYGASLARLEDPVVMTGAQLPTLLGQAPVKVVGFAWDGSAWHQVPVQVDERDLVNPATILHRASPALLPDGSQFKILAYTQPQAALQAQGYTAWDTYTPADSDPTFDANDELSFLANDTGVSVPAGTAAPAGVQAATRAVVHVTDPIAAGQDGYLYLYAASSATPAAAGNSGVHYTFSLDSGDYRATYHMGSAALAPNNTTTPNPEHSTVVTPTYSLGFGDRWLNNGLDVTAGKVAAPTNLLERGRYQFAIGVCGRSEDTFDNVIPSSPYEAAFIVNVSGPVRGIRSYMGANSGTYTAGTDVFYPQREDSWVDLRVHTIPGVMAFDDLTTGLSGLTYSDDTAPSGVPVDGVNDALPSGVPSWQMVSSATHGSFVTVRSISTDVPSLSPSRYYLDQNPASPVPCTGDAAAWGQHGTQIAQTIACTDPTIYGGGNCPTITGQSTANRLVSTRYRYFEPSNTSATTAARLRDHALNPLQVSVQ